MKTLRVFLGLLALVGESCGGPVDRHTYNAEFSAWAMELTWKHEWETPPTSDPAADRYRFEALKLVLKPSRLGQDQDIDGTAVVGTFIHGGTDWCTKAHRVAGKVCLLELGATDVHVRLDAVMDCPGSEPVALKGEYTFETKVPP